MNLKFNKKNYKSNLVEFSENIIFNNYFNFFYFIILFTFNIFYAPWAERHRRCL